MQKKASDRIQHLFMIKVLKLGTEGNFLNLIKGIYEKPTVSSILSCRKGSLVAQTVNNLPAM